MGVLIKAEQFMLGGRVANSGCLMVFTEEKKVFGACLFRKAC
jgi:hypothetical protein